MKGYRKAVKLWTVDSNEWSKGDDLQIRSTDLSNVKA